MSDSARITIRLSKSVMDQLQTLVDSGEFKNISDVVRAAIENFLNERDVPPNVNRVVLDLPKKTTQLLLKLVESGEFEVVDMNDAIRSAVKEYIRAHASELARAKIEEKIEKMHEEEGGE